MPTNTPFIQVAPRQTPEDAFQAHLSPHTEPTIQNQSMPCLVQLPHIAAVPRSPARKLPPVCRSLMRYVLRTWKGPMSPSLSDAT